MNQPIKLIVTDLDGTLFNSQHQLTERTEKALKAAIEQSVKIVLATGKTRVSGVDVAQRLNLDTPGIYLQGLAIYNADGSIRWQQTLDPNVARTAINVGEDRGFTMVAYSGTRVLCRACNRDTDELMNYHEGAPEAVGPLQNILDDVPVNKVLAIKLAQPRQITGLRWQLGTQINGTGKLVQALDDMLEILPPGASKGTALKLLLKDLKIPAEQVLAIGDGENDIEMVQLAGVGVAVGNAHQKLKDVADQVVASNDEDGVAEAVERFVLAQTPAPVAESAAQ
jgi:Cof subfamily protein (haloacid dehalogenase superfamily)